MLVIVTLSILFWTSVFILLCNGAFKQGLNDAISATQVFATINDMCYGPLIRANYSREALGLPAVFAAIMILLSAGAANSPAILCYFIVWLLAVTGQRAGAARSAKSGLFTDSRYDGWPWLAMKILPSVKREDSARRYVEPLLCLAAGLCLFPMSKALGVFIMMGSFSFVLKAIRERKANRPDPGGDEEGYEASGRFSIPQVPKVRSPWRPSRQMP